jgi:hypothetical protein
MCDDDFRRVRLFDASNRTRNGRQKSDISKAFSTGARLQGLKDSGPHLLANPWSGHQTGRLSFPDLMTIELLIDRFTQKV